MEEKEFSSVAEFRKSIVPVRGEGKVKNCIGAYDIYKKMRHEGWQGIGHPVSQHDYYMIVRNMNRLMAEEIAKGNPVILPCNMGRIDVRKYQTGVKMKNGKLKISYPVDWGETFKLWFEDKEARKMKCVVRNESGIVYKIIYSKHTAKYNNKSFYEFSAQRSLKKMLMTNINKGGFDTLYELK